MGVSERLYEIIRPLADDLDVELVDVEYAGGVVRVTVDRSAGVDLDAVARLTRAVSRAMDEHDPIAGRYTLEVSSPGLERTLRTPVHFSRAIGAVVRVKTRPGVEGDRRVEGVLAVADDEGIVVAAREGDGERRIAYGEIERARTVFEWGPAPKPGSARKPAKAAEAGSDNKAVNA